MVIMCKAEVISNHVGVVGGRITATLTVIFAKYLGETEWGYSKFMVSLKDAANNIYIYYGSHYIGEAKETINIKATVFKHSTYKNIKQTIIKRPKIIKEIVNG